jgi:hypothetical protein
MPLVCRDCLAYSASNTDFQQQLPQDHCNQDKDQADTTTDYVDMHSSGECDCGDIDVLVSTKQDTSAHLLKNSLEKPSFNYFTSNEPAPILLTGSVLKQLKPDRACLHPHKKYCIQLK